MLAFTTCILLGATLGLRLAIPGFLVALFLSTLAVGLAEGMFPALFALLALETGYPLGLLLRSRLMATRRA